MKNKRKGSSALKTKVPLTTTNWSVIKSSGRSLKTSSTTVLGAALPQKKQEEKAYLDKAY
jgi:hypothetical protein